MAWKDNNRLIESAVNVVVYQGATHGEHAGKLSTLLTTRHGDVYGLGMNTLVTNSIFNTDYPMQEGKNVFFSSWVKVEKLCDLTIRKIVVGFGWGAAVTRSHDHLVVWGTGATTYVRDPGVEIVELFDPDVMCRFCNYPCASYGRRIGKTWFSYCKVQQRLVTYSTASPQPEGILVRRLGNRKFGALICSLCMKECDIEVVENYSFNFCNTCNRLWDLDVNAMPLNVTSKPRQSFLRMLDYQGRIRDVAPGQWGFWVLLDSNRLAFSGFFAQPDTREYYCQPIWWKQPLSLPVVKLPHKAVLTNSNKTDVFVIADSGALYRRAQVEHKRSDGVTHKLNRMPFTAGVKKICCGLLASLCLLDDGTIWVIYSHDNAEQTDAEEVGKGSNRCVDVSGISYADLFYVQTSQYQGRLTKRHPQKSNTIEIIFGDMDCKTFLLFLSERCRVWSEGKVAYDELAVAELINNQAPSLPTEEDSIENEELLENSAPDAPPVSAGLGFPVGVTLWSSWRPRLIQMVAGGWRCFAELSKRAYSAALKTIGSKSPKFGAVGSSSSAGTPQPANLPPFQSGLYGKTVFSDFTLRLFDGHFPAHRIVLCSTSKYFRDKLAGSLSTEKAKHSLASPTAHCDIKSLDVKTYNPRAYRCLLKYFYQIEPDNLIATDMLDLLVLAATYRERRIAGEVEDKIKSMIDVDNVTTILEVAKKSGFKNLRSACELFIRTEPDYAQETYEPTTLTTSTPTISFESPFQTNSQQKQ